ncbi:MAG TPA: NDP-sugar synthase [Acidimicrobiales bacterium]|nr:NDP-sugar synthase [Acidimicrobiales bacterium]
MRAVVLVGGFGTRLRPLTLTTPKQLLPVVEVTMIERVVGHLVEHGVDDVVLSMGYLPQAFHEAFPDGRCAGAALHYAVEPEPLDTAGAIRFAARHAGIDERFLVVNGDVLTDLDVGALVGLHDARGAEGTIALTKVDDPSAFGVVPTDEDGRVVAFVEKPPRDEAPTDLVNAGTYVLEPSVLARIDDGRKVSVERETFPAMVADRSLFAMASPAYWLDAGRPDTYLTANLDLLDGGIRPGPPHPSATAREPGVWFVGRPIVDGGLEAPVLIGDAALVASGATIERSVVGGGARVHRGAAVRRSVLLPGSVVHDGALVVDSVVGPGAVVGAGARLGGHSVVAGGCVVPDGAVLDGCRVPEGPTAH